MKMIKSVQELSMDGYLKKNLDVLKVNIKRDWDFWIIIDGYEGSGKSTLGEQVGLYLDPTLNIDNIVFTPRQFEAAVDKANKYQCIIWDESVTGTQSTDLTKMARTLKKKAVQMRQKNLFIILIIHAYQDMNRYYAVHRTWFLLNVYFIPNEDKGIFQRGHFKFFDFNKKKSMYLNDKARRFYNYSEKANFWGRFYDQHIIPRELYLKKKADIKDGEEELNEPVWFEACIRKGMTWGEIERYTTMTERWYYKKKKSLNA